MSSKVVINVVGLSKVFDMNKQPLLRILYKLLGKSVIERNKVVALKNVTFEVEKGSSVGIIGKNGSGKSTLLQLISKTLYQTSGNIYVDGKVAALLELGAGFDPDFTGKENIYMNAKIFGLKSKIIDERFESIVSFADIGDFIDKQVKIYSSGMFVRLAFAVIAHVDADILIIDEALAVGDEGFQRKCYSFLEKFKNSGGTILFVSHSPTTILTLCDKVLLLDKGELLASGEAKLMLGYYQQLLYASGKNYEELRLSILNKPDNYILTETEKVQISEVYDDSIKSESLISYPSNGAIIKNVAIFDSKNNKINILKQGEIYYCCYDVDVIKKVKHVRCGILIKTVSGIELGGDTTDRGKDSSIESIDSGKIIYVKFKFRCLLNPGKYYLNVGVQGSINEDYTYLHRLLDAYAFNVIQNEYATTAFVNFDFESSYKLNKDVS